MKVDKQSTEVCDVKLQEYEKPVLVDVVISEIDAAAVPQSLVIDDDVDANPL